MLRLIGSLALLAYVFVGTSYAGILCFGADGHVAFEQLRDEHPIVRDSAAMGATQARVIALIAGDTSAGLSHGPCFDVALDAGSQWRAGTKTESARLPMAPLVLLTDVVVVPLCIAHSPGAGMSRPVPADSPVLTSLGSTVLRI